MKYLLIVFFTSFIGMIAGMITNAITNNINNTSALMLFSCLTFIISSITIIVRSRKNEENEDE